MSLLERRLVKREEKSKEPCDALLSSMLSWMAWTRTCCEASKIDMRPSQDQDLEKNMADGNGRSE